MQPLPLVDAAAGLVFSMSVGLFAVVQLASSLVSSLRARGSVSQRLDRWSLPFVFLCAGLGVLGAFWVANHVTNAAVAAQPAALRWALFVLGITVIIVGTALRLWAILVLGRWFTYDVRVTEGQPVVQTGPYRWVRHPSYTGVLLVLFGIGLTLGNWLSVLLLVALPSLGLVRRIHVEESALLGALGEPYERYAAGRPRLFPGLW